MNKDNSIIYFSVIIPLYNKEKSVTSTVESVLNQTYPHFELIIVNDGSTDNSLEVVQEFDDSRIRIIDKANDGVSSARNVGIKASRYDYIIPLDADDLWESFALAEFVELIDRFGDDAKVFCTSATITGKTRKGTTRRYIIKDYYYASAVFLAKWGMPVMVTGTVAIEKHCFLEVGYYDEKVAHGEDVDLWLRLKSKFQIAKSEFITMTYRLNTENRASNVPEEKKIFKEVEDIQNVKKLSKSEKLYEGCENLQALKTGNLFVKNNVWQSLNTVNWYWVIRALLLFFKHRIMLPLLDNMNR